MKRVACGLCAWLALSFATGGLAKAQDDNQNADQPAAAPPGDTAQPPPAEAPAAEPPSAEPPSDEGQVQTPIEKVKPSAVHDYSGIYVVPRRPVLKRHRIEFMPTYDLTINNSVIRHHGFGGEINIYLSEAFYIGVEGTYYEKQLLDRYFLLGLDQRVLPSVNHWVWSAFLDFGYVPIYGKFALFNSAVFYWEAYIGAGVGVFQSDVIPRDPANSTFTSYLVSGLLPAFGVRLWLARWLAFDAYLKNYIFVDKLEPTNRVPMETGDMAASRAESQFTFNIMFGVGLSIFLPPGFEYHTPR